MLCDLKHCSTRNNSHLGYHLHNRVNLNLSAPVKVNEEVRDLAPPVGVENGPLEVVVESQALDKVRLRLCSVSLSSK